MEGIVGNLRRKTRLSVYSVLALLVTGCDPLTSTRIESGAEVPQFNKTGISYFLPKKVLKIQISKFENSDPKITIEKINVVDEKTRSWAGFGLSITSDDIIQVKTTKDGLLDNVSVDVTDRTVEIGKKIVNLVVKAGGLRALPADEVDKRVFEFDPFDINLVRDINKDMFAYAGYCVLVMPETMTSSGDECVEIAGIPSHLTARNASVASGGQEIERFLESTPSHYDAVPRQTDGVYFRRAFPYRVEVFRDVRSGGKSAGRIEKIWSGLESFENRSPVLALKIERRPFVQTKTVVDFEDGELLDVKVTKKSELEALIEFPVAVVDGLLGAATQNLTNRENDQANTERDLAIRENALKLKEREAKIKEQEVAAGLTRNAGNRSGTYVLVGQGTGRFLTTSEVRSLISRCVESGGTEDVCSREVKFHSGAR